jgi:MFS transporter, ACS family, D-galactonate transporter
LNTGLQQVATSLAGGVSASLSGWLLHLGGNYRFPMLAIFAFLLLGAASTAILFRREWAPKVNDLEHALPAAARTGCRCR